MAMEIWASVTWLMEGGHHCQVGDQNNCSPKGFHQAMTLAYGSISLAKGMVLSGHLLQGWKWSSCEILEGKMDGKQCIV